MSKEKPNYYSIIPAEVRYDNRLSDSEKLLYGEITSLSQSTGECWASNKYFSDLYAVSLVTISRRINKLKNFGYVNVEMIYKKGTKAIEKRVIKIVNIPYQNCYDPIIKIDNTPIIKNDKDNNTSINNTSINNIKTIQKEWFKSFWEAYPKKVSVGQAEKTFIKKVVDEETLHSILKDLNKRQYFTDWTKDKGKWIPHASTYLNAEGWLDEYDVNQVESSSNEFLDMLKRGEFDQ